MDETETVLAGTAIAQGATLRAYSGALTAANFGDAASEFRALTETCGIYDLGWRGKLAFRRDDRVRWMNGMVTNNIRDLGPNHGNYNFVLNAQGRIQGDLYIYHRRDHLLGDTELSQVEPLLKLLNSFIIMDDVEIIDISGQLTSIGVQGPRAAEVLKRAGIEPGCADPLIVCDLQDGENRFSLTRMAGEDHLTYELWLTPEYATVLWKKLVDAGVRPVGTDALEKFRVMAGVPKYGQDIRDRDLPQETGQQHALSFTKGCFIGQEIVERIRSRGNVHRSFTGFVLESRVEPGAPVTRDGKVLGEITSIESVRLPHTVEEQWLALGYFRREGGRPGTQIEAAGVKGTVASLPFAK